MAKSLKLLLGGMVGAIILAPIGYLLSGEVFVALYAGGCGAVIGLCVAGKFVSKASWLMIVLIVGCTWLYVYLHSRGYLR